MKQTCRLNRLMEKENSESVRNAVRLSRAMTPVILPTKKNAYVPHVQRNKTKNVHMETNSWKPRLSLKETDMNS